MRSAPHLDGVQAPTRMCAMSTSPSCGRRPEPSSRQLTPARSGSAIRGFSISGQGQPGYLRLPLLVSGSVVGAWRTRDARRRGITPGYPRALPDLEGFGGRVLNPEEQFTGARELARMLHTLPTHSLLKDQDLGALSGWLSRNSERGAIR